MDLGTIIEDNNCKRNRCLKYTEMIAKNMSSIFDMFDIVEKRYNDKNMSIAYDLYKNKLLFVEKEQCFESIDKSNFILIDKVNDTIFGYSSPNNNIIYNCKLYFNFNDPFIKIDRFANQPIYLSNGLCFGEYTSYLIYKYSRNKICFNIKDSKTLKNVNKIIKNKCSDFEHLLRIME